MVRRAHQRDLKRIALLKNSSVDIADLPEDTPVIAADIAAPGIIDSQHLPGYEKTEIISYSTMLGSPLPDFFARTQEKRTVGYPLMGS